MNVENRNENLNRPVDDPESGSGLRGPETGPESAMPGLCRHCDFRLDCTLSTREQPVWHCEHYQ
jgi:hypothetical protein